MFLSEFTIKEPDAPELARPERGERILWLTPTQSIKPE